MTVLEWRHFSGPNVHCNRPMIELAVDLHPYHDVSTRDARHIAPRLLQSLPGLRDHHCSRGHEGGFLERLDEGTLIGHVMEHVALELLLLCGENGSYGKTRLARAPSVYLIAFEAEHPQNGLEAFELASDFCLAALSLKAFDFETRREALRKRAAQRLLGPSTAAIRDAAKARDIPVARIGDASLLQLGWGSKRRLVEATMTDRTSVVGVDIAEDKMLAKTILHQAGLPVPKGGIATSEEEAVDLAQRLGGTVVVKPADGNQGKGVTLALTTAAEVRAAFRVAQALSPRVLVESYVPGRQYRMLVVQGSVVAASERLPASVVGDGVQSVEALVREVNRDPLRGDEHEKPLTRMRIDSVALLHLARQGLRPTSVPARGQVVRLRESANLSTGGTAVDVTEAIGQELRLDCERAAQAIGLDVCGIDLVSDDPGEPLHGHGAFIEVNAAPGIRMHHYPSQGQARDAADAIVSSLFADDGRIPLVAVTGTNGKTTTVRLIAHMLARAGRHVGMTSTDGVYVDGHLVLPGDNTGPFSARIVLGDARVDAAVLECARGGLRRGGLAYDKANVGVFLNLGSDHLGQDGIETLEDLGHLKSLIVECVRQDGYAVLNADDAGVMAYLPRIHCQPVLFGTSLQSLTLQRHLRQGIPVATVRSGVITWIRSGVEERIAPLRSLAFTFAGRARPMVENALAATAAALALGLPADVVRDGLLSFDGGPQQNPGRLNVYDVGDVRVVVDYGHNPGAYEAVFRVLRDLGPTRLIGVIGMPGDRRDEDALALGAVSARALDAIIVKEDHDLRGRAPGELSALIAQGAQAAGAGPDRLQIVLDERAALEHALMRACAGDMVVVFYEKLAPILEVIEMQQKRARNLAYSVSAQPALS